MSTTPIADMVDGMVAAEAAPAAIAVAVRAMETTITALSVLPITSDNERSRGAINQANYRTRKLTKSGGSVALAAAPEPITQVITADNASGNAVTSVPLSILPVLPSDVPTEDKTERGVDVLNTEPRARQKRGARLPDDWEPSEIDRQYAAGRGMRLVEIEIEATKFRNYWTNRTDKQAAKPRWDRAWQNWILNVRGTTNGKSVIDAQDRLNAKLAEFDRGDVQPAIRGGEGTPHVRLLSSR